LKEVELFSDLLEGLSQCPPNVTRWQYLDTGAIDKVNVVAQIGTDEYPVQEFS
jgi:hypothetical protein